MTQTQEPAPTRTSDHQTAHHAARQTEAPTVDPGPKTHLEPGEVVVIAVLAVSAFIVNEMVMGVALPQVMDELGITAATGQWLTTAYALTMAVIIPATGFLMQRFNMRSLFIATMPCSPSAPPSPPSPPPSRSCSPGASSRPRAPRPWPR